MTRWPLRVYGPYKARNGYRMVVVEGNARKSIVVPSIAAGEKLRADLEQALLERGDRSVSDALPSTKTSFARPRCSHGSPHHPRHRALP